MDINDFRGGLTALLLLLFLALCVWLWFFRTKGDFDDAASLPLRDDDESGNSSDASEAKK